MRICVSNDDGWFAPGLGTLVRVLGAEHEVYVVAPDVERSGSGTALGSLDDGHHIAVTSQDVDGAAAAWSVDAPPAMCAIIGASGTYFPTPDLMLSGINAGFNTSRGITHSGTLGAATTAARMGIPAAAISTSMAGSDGFECAAEVAAVIVDELVKLPRRVAVNINVPDTRLEDRGHATGARLARRGMHEVAFEPSGVGLTLRTRAAKPSPGDTEDLMGGAITVSAIDTRLVELDVPAGLLFAINYAESRSPR